MVRYVVFTGTTAGNPNKPAAQFQSPAHALISMSIQIDRWNKSGSLDSEQLRACLRDEGYNVFQWSDAPGTKYGPHAHDEDQSHWVLSGQLEMRVGHEIYTLRAGDRDFLPANTIHSAFVPGDEPVVYLIGAKH
jgi:quercetin dioxygenase-like cupin family protein